MSADTMSPMDEFKWFQAPNFTSTALPNLTPTLILKRDPQRVGLIIGSVGAPAVFFGPDSSVGPTKGVPFTTTYPYQMLLQKDWGNLVQGEIWCYSGGGATTVYAIEIRLIDWPQPGSNNAPQGQAKTPQPGRSNRKRS